MKIVDPRDMAQPVHAGDVVNNRYTLTERVDDWGVGESWRADDARFADRPVVIKLFESGDAALSDVVIARLEAVRALRHPHVLPLVDHGAWRGREFAVHEHGAMCSLGSWIDAWRERGKLAPLAAMQEIIAHIGAALSAGHRDAPPVLHEGLSPACVMIRENELGMRARVMDFGIVPLAEPSPVPEGSARGVACMAPEQFQGEPSTPRTDVFSLGLLSLELLAALPDPNLVNTEYRGRGDVPEAVWQVFQRALATSPADRFATIDAFLEALSPAWTAPAHTPTHATAQPTPEPSTLEPPQPGFPAQELTPPPLIDDQPLRYQVHDAQIAPEQMAFSAAPVRVAAEPRRATYEMPALPVADEPLDAPTLSFDVAQIFANFDPDARADTLSTMRSNRDPRALMEMTRRYRMQAAAARPPAPPTAPAMPVTSSGFVPAAPVAPPKLPPPPPPAAAPSGSRRVIAAVLTMLLSFGAVLGVVWLLFRSRHH